MLEPYDSGRETLAKQIVALLHVESYEWNGIRETLKDISPYFQLVCETSNECLQKNGYWKLPLIIKDDKCNVGIKCGQTKRSWGKYEPNLYAW